jgi:hypothetical protein
VLGALTACLLSLQAAGAVLQAPRESAPCCCKHHGVRCHCPACEHGREVESGSPLIKSCAPGAPTWTPVAPIDPLVPEAAVVLELAPQPVPHTEPPPLVAAPAPEVPTPPPLA